MDGILLIIMIYNLCFNQFAIPSCAPHVRVILRTPLLARQFARLVGIMLAWMGGKRSKLKIAKDRTRSRQSTRSFDRFEKKTEQESQRLSKRRAIDDNAFQQLCDAAHTGSQGLSNTCQTVKTAPEKTLPIIGTGMAMGVLGQLQQGDALDMNSSHNNSSDKSVVSNNSSMRVLDRSDACSAECLDLSMPTELPQAFAKAHGCGKVSPSHACNIDHLPAASGSHIYRSNKRQSSTADVSLDLQGIALQI